MKKIVALLLFLLSGLTFWYYQKNPLAYSITIRNQKIFVEVAASEKDRRQGLSGRASLASNHGMLFLMGEAAYHGFWMGGMKFPLDFIWINDRTVVDLTENVPSPASNESPLSIKPRVPADEVLEVNAGSVQKYRISIGDIVSLKN